MNERSPHPKPFLSHHVLENGADSGVPAAELVVPVAAEASVPAFFAPDARTRERVAEFFGASIRNANTRAAYLTAARRFARWCEQYRLPLGQVRPLHVGAYVEQLQAAYSIPSVKQHLAALRMLFDYLVVGGVLETNPAASVRGPRYSIKKGKTPVLSADEARLLLNSIAVADSSGKPLLAGLRDRAMIAVMAYTFARVSAMTGMRVEDYFQHGKRWWFRLHEKGGKYHEVPAHHKAEEYVDAWIAAAGIGEEKKRPLFRTFGRNDRRLTGHGLYRQDVLRMIKRRVRAAGLPESTRCHTFRATGITAYLENGGTVEKAQAIAAHESPRTTKLYDRTADKLTLDEIEKIGI
jgi:integrase/recombinase XerD